MTSHVTDGTTREQLHEARAGRAMGISSLSQSGTSALEFNKEMNAVKN